MCRGTHITKSQPNKPGTVTAAFNRVESRSKEEEARQMKIKFNIAYLIAKEELAFTKFHLLIVLHKKNCVDINPTYDDVRCAKIIGQIADEIKSELAEQVKSAHYVLALIDGDTDVSNKECEIVYVRSLEDGKPVNRLVDLSVSFILR